MKVIRSILVIVLCLCLTGCSFPSSGSHIFVEERYPNANSGGGQSVSVRTYQQLRAALIDMVEDGTVQQTISVDQYDKDKLEQDLEMVTEDVRTTHPIAAYAVEEIACTIGTTGGVESLSVVITYLHGKAEIRRIIVVQDNAGAREAVGTALDTCEAGVVMYIEDFEETDFTQMVEDHAFHYPESVMEQPQVNVNIYPESGKSRVVEMKFNYTTSRESLKNMQSQVSPVFRSAVLYVSGDAAQAEKFSQLYSFLMERYDYTIESSITPAYSLLRHGVGDCRAFARVYAAMCRQAGLEAVVVSGTKAGGSWYWNIVCIDGVYYHMDLLASNEAGAFSIWGDEQVRESGYLWDFDAYPACPDRTQTDTPDNPEETPEEN